MFVEPLEARTLLSVSPLPSSTAVRLSIEVRPIADAGASGLGALPAAGPSVSAPYIPAQIRHAYGVDQLAPGLDGGGQIIGIVDAFNDPTIANDLISFSNAYGLAAATLKVVPQSGQTALPTAYVGEWAVETALDVEWAHAIAPGATILLVEAASDSYDDLLTAVDTAVAMGANQVSMSWGGNDAAGESDYDTHFNHPGVTFLASSGDGPGVEYPAASPYVTSVGGTTLTLDANSNRIAETAWNGSGGGVSGFESPVSYQSGFSGGQGRGVPDVSYDADPATGFNVYNTSAGGTIDVVGGTSAGAPQWAGLIALANQGRARAGLPSLGTGAAAGTNPALYQLAGGTTYTNPQRDFLDITAGNSGFAATVGYDLATGLGSPIANKLIPHLVSTPPTLAAVAGQSASSGQPLTVALQGNSPEGYGLTYSATAETQTYEVKQAYGIYEDAGGYYTNARGQQEKYLRGTISSQGYSSGGDYFYYLLPNGDLYEFTPPYGNSSLTGTLLAHLGTAVYNDPSLLWNAQNTAIPATLAVNGNRLTITPSASYGGTFAVIAGVSDGHGGSASQAFTVTVTQPPTLAPIANQTVAAYPATLTVTLAGSDPIGYGLTYSAAAETLPYALDQSYGFYEDAGGYYQNYRGQQEKYLRGKVSADNYSGGGGDFWYYLLPNGDLYEFTPSYSNPALTGAPVAHLGTAVYGDPSLLDNAQNAAVPVGLTVSGNQLTIAPNSGYSGTFVVIALDSDGHGGSASQTFQVTVQPSAPPTLAAVPNQSDYSGQPLTVTLQGNSSQGYGLTYSAIAETQTYWLRQTYGIYQNGGSYYQNFRGQQEKYLRGTISSQGYSGGGGDFWYYLLPNGDLYEFTPPYNNPALTGALVAHLGSAVYSDPSLLWNARNTAVAAALAVNGNQLTITPNSNYNGTFVVVAGVADGHGGAASQAFQVTASNAPPTIGPIPDQTAVPGQPVTVTLQGGSPEGYGLTYSATAETQTYEVKQAYGIYEDAGGYYTNARGQQEKYLRGKVSADNYSGGGGDFWYYLLPNGDLYEFTPSYSNPALVGAPVAHLGTAVYGDPSLLWNAPNAPVPEMITINGNQMSIAVNNGYSGTFVVIVTLSDGHGGSASRTFKVTV